MNVGELLRERDRLIAVQKEAKVANTKLKAINKLIAMYGDGENVSVLEQQCDKCDRSFANLHGLSMHRLKTHGIKGQSRRKVAS